MASSPADSSNTSAALSNEIYLENIAALWHVDPHTAWLIDDWGEPRDVQVESSRAGPPTASMLDAQQRRVYLHSRYDPLAEAKRIVDSVKIENSFCFVFCGLGLGHHLAMLFERTHGEACLVICEPNLDVLAAAMFSVDLSAVIASGKCVFLTRLDKDVVHRALERFSTMMMLGTQFVSHPASERIAGSFHQACRAVLTDYIAYTKTSLMTLMANARITCKNIAYNLPTFLSTPPIDVLAGRFTGQPAIVIAAGPSLRKNIDQLAALQDRAVLIAVQTTLKPLLSRGIRPHFVTSLDFHEVSKNFFEGLSAEELTNTHLVAEPKATWHVLDAYPGMISILGNDFATLCVGEALGKRGGLRAGATVAHLAYYLAEYLGCDPILFVGQDLAYSDHVFYTPGVAHHDLWRPDLNRFCTMEMKEWERIARRRPILRKIEDIHGQPIYTDETLFTYLEQFEKDFAGARTRVIDATEGGARKRGASIMTLKDAAAHFCTKPLPDTCLAYRQQCAWHDASRLEAGRAHLLKRRDDLRMIRDRWKECIKVLKELMQLTDQPKEFNRKLARVDELRSEVNRHVEIYQMVSQMAQLAELRRLSADQRLSAAGTKGTELAKRQLARDVEYVEAMVEAAEALETLLDETIERLAPAMKEATPA